MCERENAADVLADLQAWVGEPFDAAGRRYDGGKESVDRFWKDLKTDQGMSVEPQYVELAFGCPPIGMGYRYEGKGLRRPHGRRIYEPVREGRDNHRIICKG